MSDWIDFGVKFDCFGFVLFGAVYLGVWMVKNELLGK